MAISAAKIRSPSFSRSSSSTTTTAGRRRSPSPPPRCVHRALTFSGRTPPTAASRRTSPSRRPPGSPASPTPLCPSVVSASVVGIRLDRERLRRRPSTTVSDTPSTVIEPFSTTYRASAAAAPIRHVVPAVGRAPGERSCRPRRRGPAPGARRAGCRGWRPAPGSPGRPAPARPARSGRSVSFITSAVNMSPSTSDHGQADAVDRDRVAVPRRRR